MMTEKPPENTMEFAERGIRTHGPAAEPPLARVSWAEVQKVFAYRKDC